MILNNMDEKLNEILVLQNKHNLNFKLIIDENEINVNKIEIKNEVTPVTKPTKRGGVYFSDKTVWKIKITINDLGINKYLSKAMLGPNTEFQDILLKTSFKKNSKIITVSIITNLTNSMQNLEKIELNLIVKDVITN